MHSVDGFLAPVIHDEWLRLEIAEMLDAPGRGLRVRIGREDLLPTLGLQARHDEGDEHEGRHTDEHTTDGGCT